MRVTSMTELPSLVVTLGAGNENRIKYKSKNKSINLQRQMPISYKCKNINLKL